MGKKAPNSKKTVKTLTHDEASRKNIPTAEHQSVMAKEQETPIRVAYERRNRDLDPQLVWRGKDEQDWSDLVTYAPPLYIQEKVHPKVLIDDLLRRSKDEAKAADAQIDLFADFNGLPSEIARTEFYQHDANWSNRMILGDSLQVMASLAEREGLRGKVQCIYIDPPYGIKFNSNFQWSTTNRDVKDGNIDHITREPEQVKAFRDTWRDGIHSYLTYLRDRLTVARDLLTESGSTFVQIGDENVHLLRALMDEVFGKDNFCSEIVYQKAPYATSTLLPPVYDTLVWYAKNRDLVKYRELYEMKGVEGRGAYKYVDVEMKRHGAVDKDFLFQSVSLVSPGQSPIPQPFLFEGRTVYPAKGSHWKTTVSGLKRVAMAGRVFSTPNSVRFKSRLSDFQISIRHNIWTDTITGSFTEEKVYVVQTNPKVISRCLLMTSDPGDLVLDPTCGSGTTAYVAEQWGRRWITIDTSRVSLALARARIMGARYAYFLLADSREGQLKEAEVKGISPSSQPTHSDIRQGFVYERVPHITLKSIGNNADIDVIWERYQETLEPLRKSLNKAMGKSWEEWEIPREAEDPWDAQTQKLFYELRAELGSGKDANPKKIADWLQAINHNLKRSYNLRSLPERPVDPWPEPAQKLHAQWWEARMARQKEIDASIAAKADFEYLYDKPYEDKKTVRVAGPFTVESLSPHRVLGVDENDDLIDTAADPKSGYGEEWDFTRIILENLKTAGVQQAHKGDKIVFSSLTPWPGDFVCAEGRYVEGASSEPSPHGGRGVGEGGGGVEKRAAIFIGAEGREDHGI
jgi:adenine-specific DNA-methyltransferase